MYDNEPAPLSGGGPIANARWADPDYTADRYYYELGDIWIGRNPHNFDSAIGYNDKRHIIVCAGNRSGKGRSFVVNNLALWPGSTVTYDPKGELPQIVAARRGEGDDYCDGMGQDVYVLDPLNKSGIDPKYLAYFDPLSALDPFDEDGELATWAKRIARSLIDIPAHGGDQAVWAKRAVRLIALVIMHVVTGNFHETEKNLMTVLRLILEGAKEDRDRLLAANPQLDPNKVPPPEIFLLDDMADNPACRGWIATEARSLLQQINKTPKYFESVRGEAADQLDWFKSGGIEKSLNGWGDASRRFDPTRLKTDPKGISVFIVMPVDDIKTYGPWVQTVFTGIFAAVRQVPGSPESGHPILTMLDEFSSLGYQEYIASSLDNIAGSGMKLAFIVQNFGKLKKLYGDEMESFFTNAGLELYFGKIGQTATDYLQKELGQTEVVRLARNISRSENQSQSYSESIAFGETDSHGGSETHTDTSSTAHSRGRQWNWSNGVNYSNSDNWGQSEGKNMGRNYGPHIFFRGLEHSDNFGTSLNRNKGRTHTKGGSRNKGGGRSEQTTETKGTSRATGSSWQRASSRTETTTQGKTKGYQIGGGVAETFHKKPLLEAHEFNEMFRPLEDMDRDHPGYPGMMLVRIQGENPFFVRRSNYDQDEYFERCFSPDPVHGYLPLSEVPLLGYQYTEEHILPIKLPKLMLEDGYEGNALLRNHQRFNAGAELFSFKGKGHGATQVRAPAAGRVMAVADIDQQKSDGSVVTIKADIAFSAAETLEFKKSIFGPHVKSIKMKNAEADAARARKERSEREAREAEERQKKSAAQSAWQSYRARRQEAMSPGESLKRLGENLWGGAVAAAIIFGGLKLLFTQELFPYFDDNGIPAWFLWCVGIFGGGGGLIGFMNEQNKLSEKFDAEQREIQHKHGRID